MKLRYAVPAAVLLVAAAARSADITGVVTDDTDQPLSLAALRLLQAPDSAFVAGVIADDEGRFSFSGVKTGRYILETSYTGLGNEFRDVRVPSDSAVVELEPIAVGQRSHLLDEVTVKGVKTEIKVMEDTVEYNADSYKVQPNAAVGDLLKRLPGVEVGSDGKITANGKEVSKILVDGKEFFSDDPAVASKNLPASMVDKLQVVDRKSDLARLTGVDDGEEETVINLTVKKGMQNGWFGNAQAGYGTDNRYNGQFIINRFHNGNQLTLIGNANNINELGFTDGNGRRFRRFGGDQGITSTQSLGLNFNLGNEERLRVGGSVFYSHTDRLSITQRDRRYLFADSTSYDNSGSRSRDRGHNVRGDFRLEWKPDTLNTIDFRPRIALNFNHSLKADSSIISAGDANRTRVSRTLGDDDTRGKSFELAGQLIWNHKFASRPGRSFSLDARYELSNVREKGSAYSLSEFYLLNDSLDLRDQWTDNHTWSNSLRGRASWTEPLGNPSLGNFLTFAYQAQYRWNNADRLTYNHPVTIDDITGLPLIDSESLIFDTDLSNRFRNDYFNQDIRVGFKHVSATHNIDVGLSFVPQMSRSIDLINSQRNIPTRWVWNYAPYLTYRLKIGKRRSMNIRYNGRSSQPTMAQLQPVADESDPMRIVIGNPELKPSFSHNVNVRFQDYNVEAQRSIMAMAHITSTQNSIVSRTTYNPQTGGQVTSYDNVDGVWRAFGMGMFSMPLRNKEFQFNAHANFMYNRNVGFNNTLRNVSNNLMAGFAPSIAWRPDNVELELRPNYSVQKTWNSVGDNRNTLVHTYGGTFNGSYYTSFGLSLNTDLTYTATSGYARGYDRNEWMWNLEVAYNFLPGDAATVALKIYDILGQKNDISRTVTANYIDDTRFNALTRYFMVSFSYKFNTFGKGMEPRDQFGPPGGGPGGHGGSPPGGRPPMGRPPM